VAADLLRRPLVVVTGKGGVGKSTVAAAVALVAARRGLRTIVAEVALRDDVVRALGGDGAGPAVRERELGGGVHHISIDPEAALEEYLRDQLPSGALANLLAGSRLFTYLAAATPGMRELLSVGKVWELAQDARRTPGGRPYDLVVLDAPATGHGVAILQAPRTYAQVARVGPVARQGRTIDGMLSDPARTGVVAVARPEEMPVNEALALEGALPAAVGLRLDLIAVNGLLEQRFSGPDARALAAAPCGPAVAAALSAHEQARIQRTQLARLRRRTRTPVFTLPFLPVAEIGVDEIAALADGLEWAL
jgi:Mrp family chromosome partitioning ATPase